MTRKETRTSVLQPPRLDPANDKNELEAEFSLKLPDKIRTMPTPGSLSCDAQAHCAGLLQCSLTSEMTQISVFQTLMCLESPRAIDDDSISRSEAGSESPHA